MDAVAADFEFGDDLRLIGQPFGPAFADGFLVDIKFGELDKEVIMSGLAFHKTAVELAEIGIFEAFGQAFEPFEIGRASCRERVFALV